MNTRRKDIYSNLGFDPDALREKYRQERDKRIRADGNDQYVEVTGKFAHYVDDPYVEPGFTREPLTDEVDIVDHRRRLRRPARGGARFREAGLSPTSASSKRAATSAARGTGTAIRARSATSSRTATCRCSKSSATCRKRSTRSRRRSTSTRSASPTRSTSTTRALFPDEGDRPALGRRHRALDRLHRSQRRR